jgi:hypothetical protein
MFLSFSYIVAWVSVWLTLMSPVVLPVGEPAWSLHSAARTCSNIVIAIKSGPQQKYRARRDAWRTSDCPLSYRDANVTYQFFMGIPAHEIIVPDGHNQGLRMSEKEIDDLAAMKTEISSYGDMYILPILDLYEHIYLKTYMILDYLTRIGEGAMIAIQDDEYCINMTLLMEICQQSVNKSQTVLGGVTWFEKAEYDIQKGFDGSFYPYVSGAAMIISWDLANAIVQLKGHVSAGLEGSLSDDVNIGRWANRTGLPVTFVVEKNLVWDIPDRKEEVNCGSHFAKSCEECPRGNGALWCNTECVWDHQTSSCISRIASKETLTIVDHKNISLPDSDINSCTALSHHAIVVPYRNRTSQLSFFLKYMTDYLMKRFFNDSFTILIINQGNEELFNRGFLINVGISEAAKRFPSIQCIISHDIDLIPANFTDGIVPYNDCTQPIRLTNELEHWNWSYPYPENCGGSVNMNLRDWLMINGMSNDYEGWGGEDDDLFHRLRANNLLHGEYGNENVKGLAMPPRGQGVFMNLEGGREQTVNENHAKKRNHSHYAENLGLYSLMAMGSDRWKTDGLNDLGYEVVFQEMLDVFSDASEASENAKRGCVQSLLLSVVPATNPEAGILGVEQVDCGRHLTKSCEECIQGHGTDWCNGECIWDNQRNICVSRTASRESDAERKFIVWFGQGPASDAMIWENRFALDRSAKLFYHSYDEDCEICLFKNNTNFAFGRNMALREALKGMDWKYIRYFVTFDSDLQMTCKNSGDDDQCWRDFNHLLLHSNEPIVSPKTWWDPASEPSNYQTCPDNAVYAFRGVDMLKMVYPLSYVNVEKDWTYNTHVAWHVMDRCFPNSIWTSGDHWLTNPRHGSYPFQHEPEHVFEILNQSFPELKPWKPPLLWHRCRVSSVRGTKHPTLWPKCRQAFDRRFMKWLEDHTVW